MHQIPIALGAVYLVLRPQNVQIVVHYEMIWCFDVMYAIQGMASLAQAVQDL